VHWWWVIAQLYEEQNSIGVIAVAVLHSSTEQQGSCSASTSAAVIWCCITAHLYKEQISIGVIAVAQACCQPVLQSSTEQWESCSPSPVLQCFGVASLQPSALVLGHCTPV